MKKVIMAEKPKKEEKVYLEDITNDMIVGAKYQMDRKVGIVKTSKGFIGLNANTIDLSPNWTKDSIQDYIKELGVHNEYFVFQTPAELYKWLSE